MSYVDHWLNSFIGNADMSLKLQRFCDISWLTAGASRDQSIELVHTSEERLLLRSAQSIQPACWGFTGRRRHNIQASN